jgi:hypothetical protein
MKMMMAGVIAIALTLTLSGTTGATDLDTLQAMEKQADRLGVPAMQDISGAKRLCVCELGPGGQLLGYLFRSDSTPGIGNRIVGLDCAVPRYDDTDPGPVNSIVTCLNRGGLRWEVLPK